MGHFFGSRDSPPEPPPGAPDASPGPGLGGKVQSSPDGSDYRTAPDAVCPAERDGALGRGSSDGYPLDGLSANGWYVALGRAPPSRQGRKSAQHREVTRKEPAVCESQTRVATGVTGKVRKSTAGPENPPAGSREPDTPQPVRQDLRLLGTDGAERSGPGRGTHCRRQLPHPNPSPLPQLSTTAAKKKFFSPFFADFCPPQAHQDRPGAAPGGVAR